VRGATKDELLYRGRELLDHIDVIVSGSALLYDATVNPDPVAKEIALRWVRSKSLVPQAQAANRQDWKSAARVDKEIFLGFSDGEAQKVSKL
jgi:hypothetical protein